MKLIALGTGLDEALVGELADRHVVVLVTEDPEEIRGVGHLFFKDVHLVANTTPDPSAVVGPGDDWWTKGAL